MRCKFILLTAATVLVGGLFSLLHAQTPLASPAPPLVQTPEKSTLDIILIVVQILTFVINAAALWGLFLYVRKTTDIATATVRAAEVSQRATEISHSILTEMKAARLQEIAPHVIVYFDMPYGMSWTIFFVVKNIGRSVAKDIKMSFEPPLKTGFGNKISDFDISLIKDGISSLAPGQEIRTPYDSISNYFGSDTAKMLNGVLPTKYTVEVSYRGAFHPDRTFTQQDIDFSMFKDLMVLQEKGEKELIKGIEVIADSNKRFQRSFEKIANNLADGIWLRNPEFLIADVSNNPKIWSLKTLAKLSEFKILWTQVYAGNYERPFSSYVDYLQSRLSVLSAQILIITSHAPDTVPSEITESLINVAAKLDGLGDWSFFMQGDNGFNEAGNDVVKFIDDISGKLKFYADVSKNNGSDSLSGAQASLERNSKGESGDQGA
jgi:hypothetical protein